MKIKKQWKVRRTLSHSLHEVAKILGTELTETDLLNTFDLFLHDLDPVKVGVIRNIALFLSVLSPVVRSNYIDVLVDFQNDNSNWRIRQLLSSFVFSIHLFLLLIIISILIILKK